MGKRKRKKLSSTLTWKAGAGFFQLLSQGILKTSPLLLLGVVGWVIFLGIRQDLYADPGFLIQNVEVSPQGSLPAEKIQELEQQYLGQSLFKISLRRAAETIEQDPKIREARIIREFPKTLRIEILARKPSIQIQLSPKGPYYAAGEDGVILNTEFARNENKVLIEVFEAQKNQLEIGKPSNLPGFREAWRLARAFWAHPLGKTESIDRIRLDHLGNVSLVLRKGPELRFGRQPMKKIYALDTVGPLLRGSDRDRIIYIELQYQDLIVRRK